MVKYEMSTDRLSPIFAALADPTQRQILSRLASGEASVNELAAPFAMSLPAISKHLKVLEQAGLISRGRQAQWRPCRLEAAPMKEIAEWTNAFRDFWDDNYDRLDTYLLTLQAKDTPSENAPMEETTRDEHDGRIDI